MTTYFTPSEPSFNWWQPQTQSTSWTWPQYDYILTKARAIAVALESKAITRKEAREMLAALDPCFSAVLGTK